MKKKNVMIITAALLACAITITGIARAVRGGGSAVDVTQVSYLNSGWWDEGTSTSGYVTANASQDVYLESDSIVEKVYVKIGDKVVGCSPRKATESWSLGSEPRIRQYFVSIAASPFSIISLRVTVVCVKLEVLKDVIDIGFVLNCFIAVKELSKPL